MKTIKFFVATSMAAAVALSIHAPAHAAGFESQSLSTSAMGTANAGISVYGSDATNQFANPATLSDIKQPTLSLGGQLIVAQLDFSDQGTENAFGAPIPGEGNVDDFLISFVPSLYLALPMSDSVAIGLSVNTPFASKTEYDDDWVGRYHTTNSEIVTYNINPALSFKVSDSVSLGFGVSAQMIDATLESAVNQYSVCFNGALAQSDPVTPAVVEAAATNCAPLVGVDGQQKLTGDSWAYGWNVGAIFQVAPSTRLAFDYRSEVKHDLDGTASFTGIAPNLTANGTQLVTTSASLGVDLPQSLSVAMMTAVGPNTDLMLDVSWMGWSSFDELVVDYDSEQDDTALPQNWEDAFRFAAGFEHRYSSASAWKMGIAFDETPVPNSEYRSPRIPDSDRVWLSVGWSSQLSESMDLDLGYTHVFINGTQTANVSPTNDVLQGNYNNSADILGAQLNWRF
ncbi:MAG: OmpP1/FadL family transporter [Pseudomonadota bacterium]|nr:OmpP1/FadL family transporter [Pseudomonadota bacterium]